MLVSLRRRDQLIAWLGPLAQRTDYLLFTGFLDRSQRDWEAKDAGLLQVHAPHELINLCRGLKPDAAGSGAWLAAYCEAVGTTFVDFIKREQVRRVDVSFLPPRGPLGLEDLELVHIATGEPVAHCRPEQLPTIDAIQRRILDYHKRLDPRLHDVHPADAQRALDMMAGDDAARARDDANGLLDCILGPPRYTPPASGKTFRMFDSGWSNVRRELRHGLMPHLVELDLRAAHFTIFEHVCGVHKVRTPLLTQLLASAGDVWASACLACGVPAEQRDELKLFFLKAVFGMGDANLEENLGALPFEVLTAPLLREIYAATRELGAVAKKRGGLKGAGGRKVRLVDGWRPSTVIHMVCSHFELALIEAVYATAESPEWAGCYVALLQHDGCAVGGPDELLDGFIAACRAAVAERAAELGIRTGLVIKGRPVRFRVPAAQELAALLGRHGADFWVPQAA